LIVVDWQNFSFWWVIYSFTFFPFMPQGGANGFEPR